MEAQEAIKYVAQAKELIAKHQQEFDISNYVDGDNEFDDPLSKALSLLDKALEKLVIA